MIPYGRQALDDDDIRAVTDVLRGDWLTQGPHIEEFEAAIAARVGARHVIAFTNGTAALHGATSAAGLGPGDVVATSPLSFVASANCARFVGADVTFVDIDPATLNIDTGRVPDVDALVAVHYAGLPVDLAALPRRPRVLIEDAAHALGAITPDGPVGNCARSDMCVFSFHPVKTVTSAEGGAVSTNSDELAESLRRFRNHDMTRPPDAEGWQYEIESLAFNYRMTDMQAALGTSQLAKLDRFVDRRNDLATRYRELLARLPVELPPAAARGSRHAYHLFVVQVEDRTRVFRAMRDAGIGVQVHYVPIYRFGLYGGGAGAEQFPSTERAYTRMFSLPLFPALTDAEQDRVVTTLERCL